MTTCRKRTDHRPMDGHDPKYANLRALPRRGRHISGYVPITSKLHRKRLQLLILHRLIVVDMMSNILQYMPHIPSNPIALLQSCFIEVHTV